METVLAAVCWLYAFRYCGDTTRLSWMHEDPKSVAAYLIYRSTDPAVCNSTDPIPGEPIAKTTSTQYRDTVKGATSACYEIAAVGKDGAISARSPRQVWLAGGTHE